MIDSKTLSRAGCPLLGTPYATLDCQAFVEACLKSCGLSLNLAGSNAWLRRVASEGWIGSPEDCRRLFGAIPPGAFLFIRNYDGGEPAKYRGDGFGNASHIGLYTALSGAEMVALASATGARNASSWNFGSGAIHSSKSRGGVATSSFSGKSISGGWNLVGLWRSVDYGERINALLRGETPSPAPSPGPGPSPSPSPAPAPEPTPDPEPAQVVSPNGKPVNTRKGPDESYPLSKAGRIPVGARVEILRRQVNAQGEPWCRIAWTDPRGARWACWMKEDFLVPLEEEGITANPETPTSPEPPAHPLYASPIPVTPLFTVHIPFLPEYQAAALVARYPGSWRTTEGDDACRP